MATVSVRRFFSLAAAFVCLFASTGAWAQSAPLVVPFADEWAASPHAWIHKEAFTHWNDEGTIPTAFAKCHATSGLHDYLGLDGTEAGKVDKEALVGKGITCVACHNEAIKQLTSVEFPSGSVLEVTTTDRRCMLCHQGRQSTPSVNTLISEAGVGDDDVSDKLKFLNIHYRAAAATRYGTEVQGGYEYDGKEYVGLYVHDEFSTLCSDCHDNHTLQVTLDRCTECHKDLEKRDQFREIRTTKKDFDGDGNIEEGIDAEIVVLHEELNKAIMAYGKEVAGQPIVYDSHQYPYFFNDTNGNGVSDEGEARYPNRYQSWTPRLLRAAYNYQYVAKDPGAYTHNPFYALQLLQDSLGDLATKVEVANAGTNRP